MKTFRIILAVLVLMICIVLALWAAGVIDFELAKDVSGRVVWIVGILGVASTLIYFLVGRRPSQAEKKNEPNSGPNF